MSYAVYRNSTNNIARYHVYEVHSLGDGKTSNGDWLHDVPDIETVFDESMSHPKIHAVVPCRICLPNSTAGRCVGCYDTRS